MNKFEKLYQEILRQTREGTLSWSQVHKSTYNELVFQAPSVFRAFLSKFERYDGRYDVLLVEKKILDQEDYHERYYCEILFIQDNELVAELNEGVIEKSDLIRIAQIVSKDSNKAKKLFGED